MSVPPGRSQGVLGMGIFLVSLSVLFLASIIGVLIVRFRSDAWHPAGAPDYPITLWASTLVLLASSFTMHRALRGVRADASREFRRMLRLTLGLGAAFLLLQGFNWLQLAGAGLPARTSLYAFTFYVLTALHALHVAGGLVPLSVLIFRAGHGAYDAESHAGVEYTAMYWHFLDAVWIVLFILLLSS